MYLNILEEENEVSYNNRNSSKVDRTLFPLLYKKLSLRMRRTDGANDDDNVNNVNRALLQSFCNNAFIPMLNEIPIQISRDGGNTFEKVSEVPVMDRADEGLFTRAGTSIIYESGLFHAFYSVGSSWYQIAGKERPIYQINYHEEKFYF